MTTPSNEAERLEALRDLHILDTPPEDHFDAVCRTAERLFGVPNAFVSLIDSDRLWLKTPCAALDAPITRRQSFCDHTIRADAVMVVQDAREDPRFAGNPLVTGATPLVFYAGAPLILRQGVRVGALCLTDTMPRSFTDVDVVALTELATIVVAQLRHQSAEMSRLREAQDREAHERMIVAQAQELRRNATKLVNANRLLTMAEQIAHVGHWRVSLADNQPIWSDGIYRIAGRDRLLPPPTLAEAASIYHPDDRALVNSSIAEALARRSDFAFDARLLQPSGEVRHITVRGICECDAEGEPIGLFGTVLDLTESRRADAALREKRSEFRRLVDGVSDCAFVTLDRTGHVATWNSGAQRITGYSAHSVIGRHVSRFYTQADLDAHLPRRNLATAAFDGRLKFEGWRVRQDGSRFFASVAIDAIRDEGGEVVGFAEITRNITERKAAEAALEAATAEARAARGEAEQASAAKSDFLAAMSHEIRTPLNSILGYADLLLDERRHAPEDRRRLELIQGSGAALLAIVNDILDFSKLEAGQFALDPAPFSMRAIIEDTVAIVRGGALKSPVTIRADIAPSVPAFAVGDSSRLRQVLLNLLNNAVKFTPAGSVTLNVRGEGSSPQGEALCFEVIDTGIGIAPQNQSRLFQRFSQVDSSIGRRFGGTGLGLAISSHLVRMMGGAIGAASAGEDAGSTFWFTVTLPLAEATPSIAPPRATEEPRSAARARLLVAEDVPVNQTLARAVLELAGHSVDMVGDGAEAVAAVAAKAGGPEAYDLVLMDLQMPGMDGLSATRLIRALPAPASRTPIIAMTANVLPQQIAALRLAGMDDHVGKPFKRDALYATIDRWVSAEPDTAILDPNVFSTLRDSVGAARAQGLLSMLADELMERFGASSSAKDREQLAHDAHAMVSATDLLGFVGLSGLCREIEAACRSGADIDPLVRRLAILSEGTLAEIRMLQAA